MKKFALLMLLLCWWGCHKEDKPTTSAKGPASRVPPEDIWASMRKLEKFRKDVDKALMDWDAEGISTTALKVSREITLFPELYEGVPKEFMQYANILKAKSDATAEAMKTENFAQARTSWGEVLRACQGCHEVWDGPERGFELPPETERPTPPPASIPVPVVDPACGKKGQKKCPKKEIKKEAKKETSIQDPFKNSK
jgi:hypothetical protein